MESCIRKAINLSHPFVVHLIYIIRLGQEPPPRPVEDSFDGRSLAEVSGIDSLALHGRPRTTLTLSYWFDVMIETCRK